MPVDIKSRRALRSVERESSDDAVKKLTGLSSAVLTFLPVARRVWVVAMRPAVCWRDSRVARTPADRVILEPILLEPFWPEARRGRVGRTGHSRERPLQGPTAVLTHAVQQSVNDRG